MIYLYGNGCVQCNYVRKVLNDNHIPYKYINVNGFSLAQLKDILKDDYEQGLKFPIIYNHDGSFVTNLMGFIRGVETNDGATATITS